MKTKELLENYMHYEKSTHKHKSKKDYKRNNKVRVYL